MKVILLPLFKLFVCLISLIVHTIQLIIFYTLYTLWYFELPIREVFTNTRYHQMFKTLDKDKFYIFNSYYAYLLGYGHTVVLNKSDIFKNCVYIHADEDVIGIIHVPKVNGRYYVNVIDVGQPIRLNDADLSYNTLEEAIKTVKQCTGKPLVHGSIDMSKYH